MLSLLIDAFIVILLIAAIGYGWIISRRVDRLMKLLAELAPVVQEFSAAVDKSERSVEQLRSETERKQEAEAQAETRNAAAPAPKTAEPQGSGMFASRRGRGQEGEPLGLVRLGGKSDLVRGFFASSRSRTN